MWASVGDLERTPRTHRGGMATSILEVLEEAAVATAGQSEASGARRPTPPRAPGAGFTVARGVKQEPGGTSLGGPAMTTALHEGQ